MDLGPNAIFIWASYGVVAGVLIALTGWLILEGSRLHKQLEDLEQRGIRRRSASVGPRPPSGPAS